MRLDHIGLAPGFAREVVEVYEKWEGREALPMKVKELMLILQIEVSKLYRTSFWSQQPVKPKLKMFRDTRLG